MKRWFVLFLCICTAVSLASCGGGGNGQASGSRFQTTESGQTQAEQPDLTQPESGQSNEGNRNEVPVQADGSDNRILIAYFTWADNTVVEDEEAAIESALSHYESVGDSGNYEGIDATSSASIVVPGNTAQMAEWIQERTDGDLFSIVVSEPYSSNYDECLDRAADEKAEDARPELAVHVEDMGQYDTIFLGFPNWWSSAPMAVFSFIEEYDFSGKTVIPFCAHGTGGIARSVRDITAALPDSAKILEPIGVYRLDIRSSQPVIDEWLESLGFEERETSPNMENEEKN